MIDLFRDSVILLKYKTKRGREWVYISDEGLKRQTLDSERVEVRVIMAKFPFQRHRGMILCKEVWFYARG